MKTNFLQQTQNIFKTATLLGLALMLANCSGDDDPSPVVDTSQNPLSGYVATAGFDQVTTNFVNSGDYEFGISFTPAANGKMTAIVMKLPAAQSAGTRVSIWNKTTSTLMRTETIDVPTADTEVVKAITPIDLVAGTEYCITYNGNDWYKRNRTDNSNATYPITVGDISVTSYRWVSGTAQVIPTNIPNNYYAGDLSFKFVRN